MNKIDTLLYFLFGGIVKIHSIPNIRIYKLGTVCSYFFKGLSNSMWNKKYFKFPLVCKIYAGEFFLFMRIFVCEKIAKNEFHNN